MLRLDYALNHELALDLNFGYTSAATRSWNAAAQPQTTQGLMDTQLGVRYRLLDESQGDSCWMPTMTARLGGIIKGTYDADFPMAPGDGASGIELSLLSTKRFAWGTGIYANFGYRLRDYSVPQTIFGSTGLSQMFKFDWIINSITVYAGYRGLYDLNGSDLSGGRVSGVPHDYINLDYTRTAQETYQLGELGLDMTDRHGHRYFFACGHPFEGRNTGKANNFIIGLDWPIHLW